MSSLARPGRARDIVLHVDPSVASAARVFVTEALVQLGRPDLTEVGALLVTELVTNVVRHTGAGSCTVILRSGPGAGGRGPPPSVTVEVVDGEKGEVAPGPAPGDRDEHGRGLRIVRTLADEWGVRRTETDKTVWFRLA